MAWLAVTVTALGFGLMIDTTDFQEMARAVLKIAKRKQFDEEDFEALRIVANDLTLALDDIVEEAEARLYDGA